MKPIGMLMIEHRLIERMLGLLKEELARMEQGIEVDASLLNANIDFFRIYADRTHHGKEENILFKELAKKPLSSEHREMMTLLMAEHKRAREIVGALGAATQHYAHRNAGATKDITACIAELAAFYPKHIEKEDKEFFFPSMEYFSKEEQDAMLQQFREFDQMMIHEKYRQEVAELTEKLEK